MSLSSPSKPKIPPAAPPAAMPTEISPDIMAKQLDWRKKLLAMMGREGTIKTDSLGGTKSKLG